MRVLLLARKANWTPPQKPTNRLCQLLHSSGLPFVSLYAFESFFFLTQTPSHTRIYSSISIHSQTHTYHLQLLFISRGEGRGLIWTMRFRGRGFRSTDPRTACSVITSPPFN